MDGLIVAAVFFGLVFVTVAMGVKLVPQVLSLLCSVWVNTM